MLSDEMTTGSVTSSESHKRAFAARSHSWNVSQSRFRDAFPEVSNLPSIISLSVPGSVPTSHPVGLIVGTIPSFLLLCNLIDMGNESHADVDFIALFASITRFT